MRKNKMMRTAAVLSVATLLTASVLSGTFAKYTTSVDGTDTARVAKWGFTDSSSVKLDNLFANAYDTATGKKVDYSTGGSVKSSAENTKVIAPGTSGSATFGFVYGGATAPAAPEVAYTFTVDTTESNCADSIKKNPNIKWALDATDNNATYGTWDELLDSIARLADGSTLGNGDTKETTATKQYAPGELPEAFKATDNNTHTVSWKWEFEPGTDDATKKTQNEGDTAMGNAETLADVTLKITITATQVD